MSELMTPQHPRWNEFVARLNGAMLPLQEPDTGELSWICPSDPTFPLSSEILTVISGIDLGATLAFFADHAACDCEILLNEMDLHRAVEQ
jgi:hypothetical protein